MSIFSQLKQAVSEKFAQQEKTQGLNLIQASVCLPDENFPLLGWLKAQKNSYPHFYLQHRDSEQTIASVGKIKQFDTLEDAQQFVESDQQTLLGGLQFEGKSCFILPRLKLVKEGKNLTACCYVEGSEAVDFEEIFANFEEIQPLALTKNPQISAHSAYDFAQWQANIAFAVSQIRAQHFSKVVLANATTLTFEKPISAYDLLAKSQQTNNGCYHFLWAETADSAFIGSTPERLYQRQGNQLKTEALAGTVAVSDDAIQTERNALWLLSDEKNIFENQLVVDDIEQHLKNCVANFDVGKLEIKRLRNVQHLRRQISAELQAGILDHDCLTQIHPTAAIAGLPRQTAKQFIAQNEPFKRNWYAGTLGYFGQNEAEFCVTLRSAQIEQNQITVYAGAGIVLGSEAESEWLEIERKSQAMIKLLA